MLGYLLTNISVLDDGSLKFLSGYVQVTYNWILGCIELPLDSKFRQNLVQKQIRQYIDYLESNLEDDSAVTTAHRSEAFRLLHGIIVKTPLINVGFPKQELTAFIFYQISHRLRLIKEDIKVKEEIKKCHVHGRIRRPVGRPEN